MTQPEINNLVKLLMSGDEQNILMAKAMCEGQNRIDIIQEAYSKLKQENNLAHRNLNKRYSKQKDNIVWAYGDKCRYFEIVFSSDVWNDIGYIEHLRKYRSVDMNWQIDEDMQNYYNSFAL